MASATALHVAAICSSVARPNRLINRVRDNRNVLSQFTTDTLAKPCAIPTATSVDNARIVEVTGAQIAERR